jgi:riboflavin biosynthesis pyrimidine reductase
VSRFTLPGIGAILGLLAIQTALTHEPQAGPVIVAVLTEGVSDAHLAGLRNDGFSYIFAGERQVDLGGGLDILNPEPGITRLALECGGNANRSFLRAGLIGKISLAIFPAVVGTKGAPCVFASWYEKAGAAAPVRAMTLESSEILEGRRGLAPLSAPE